MVKKPAKASTDAYGEMLKWQLKTGEPACEIIERDDGYIDTGSDLGRYFLPPQKWSSVERRAVAQAKGRVLDIGCGAGRHSLYLQERGLDVTAIDASRGAIDVAKQRGVRKALVRPIEEIDKFADRTFDSVIMMGNNFGLLASLRKARRLLKVLDRITTDEALIIAATRDPYQTDRKVHLDYHRYNRSRNRMSGQIRFRVRFARSIGPWFDYLLVSPDEMREVLNGTPWELNDLALGKEGYVSFLAKRSARP